MGLLPGSRRVLLADSSARMRRVLRLNFETLGIEVFETTPDQLRDPAIPVPINGLVINLDGCSEQLCQSIHWQRHRNGSLIVAAYSVWPMRERFRQLCLHTFQEAPLDVPAFTATVNELFVRQVAV